MRHRDVSKIVSLPQDAVRTFKRAVSGWKTTLPKSEDWLQLAAQASELGLWYWDEVRQELDWDLKTRGMFGAAPYGTVSLQTFIDALHPEDRDRVMRTWRHTFEFSLPYSIDLRAVRPDGSVRWIQAYGKGYYDKAGKPLSMVGVVFDVTERKQIEQERLELAGRLINAQEEERSHIARELHDDFSQRITLVEIGLERLSGIIKDSPAASSEVHELSNKVRQLGADLHSLSHRLHSSKLDYLGLVAGVRGFCKEFTDQHGIEVDFVQENVSGEVPRDAALCLFRIVQEGLWNVKRHSGADRAQVRLKANCETVCLTLTDNGVGFGLSTSSASAGIGILSMKERARMVGGTFEVRSLPMQGTEIVVTVPIRTIRAPGSPSPK